MKKWDYDPKNSYKNWDEEIFQVKNLFVLNR
jgi:hypothetical protein